MFRTLTQKVALAAMLFISFTALAGAVEVSSILAIRSATSDLINNGLKDVEASRSFHSNVRLAILEMQIFALTRQPTAQTEVQSALDQAARDLATLKALAETHSDSEAYTRTYEQRQALLNAVQQTGATLAAAASSVDNAVIIQSVRQLDQYKQQIDRIDSVATADLAADVAGKTSTVYTFFQWALYATALVFALATALVLLQVVALRRWIVTPVNQLAQLAGNVAAGDLAVRVAVTNRDEVGGLQGAFNQMVQNLRAQHEALQERHAELQQSVEAQQRLFATVQQLSTPLLPVLDDVVVLPIVGHVDAARAAAILNVLLSGVQAQRARTAIVDVTGLAAVDTNVLQFIGQLVQATRLLGANVLLVGMSGAMAQAVVADGYDLQHVPTYRDLRSAIEATLQRTAPAVGNQPQQRLAHMLTASK